MKRKIKIKNFLPANITTRRAVDIIAKNYEFVPEGNYIFDFSEIDFVSRSFTDELIKLIQSKKINWKFVNAPLNIQVIFNKIAENNKKRDDQHTISIVEFNNQKEFRSFLQSL